MNLLDLAPVVIASAIGAAVLRGNLWRAVLVLRPSAVSVETDAPADRMSVPRELAPVEAKLVALGFERLGSHFERPPFGKEMESLDWVHREAKTFATAFLGTNGHARFYFLTATTQGGLVLTANHRRQAREQPGRYLSGSMEALPPERIFKAHRRRVSELGEASGELSLEARVALARGWYAGVGGPEVRAQHGLGLLWTLGTFGMVAAVVVAVVGGRTQH